MGFARDAADGRGRASHASLKRRQRSALRVRAMRVAFATGGSRRGRVRGRVACSRYSPCPRANAGLRGLLPGRLLSFGARRARRPVRVVLFRRASWAVSTLRTADALVMIGRARPRWALRRSSARAHRARAVSIPPATIMATTIGDDKRARDQGGVTLRGAPRCGVRGRGSSPLVGHRLDRAAPALVFSDQRRRDRRRRGRRSPRFAWSLRAVRARSSPGRGT
jgi:hypothetical protein